MVVVAGGPVVVPGKCGVAGLCVVLVVRLVTGKAEVVVESLQLWQVHRVVRLSVELVAWALVHGAVLQL